MRGFWRVGAPILLAEAIALGLLFTYHAEWEEGRIKRFLLMDDAMISLSYARSLVEGCGLVWYCGAEKVEGITNMGWTLYMAFWLWVGVPPAYGALPILLTGLLTLAIYIREASRLARLLYGRGAEGVVAWTLAVLPPVWVWHSAGLETGALATLLVLLLKESLRPDPCIWRVATFCLLGVFLRMDFFWWAILPLLWIGKQQRAWKLSLTGLGYGVGAIVALTIFRKLYYGDWLPHTYLLKVADIPLLHRWANGFLSGVFHGIYNLPLWIVGLVGLWRDSARRLLWGGVIGMSISYNLHVGGDIEEMAFSSNRFLWMGAGVPLGIGAARVLGGFPTWIQGIGVLAIGHGIPLYPMAWGARWRALVSPVGAFFLQDRWNEEWRHPLLGVKPYPIDRYVRSGATLAVSPAGTYPYFFRQYRWIDFFGKSTRQVREKGTLYYCSQMPYLLYFVGHTRWGWEAMLRSEGWVVHFFGLPPEMFCEVRSRPLPSCERGLGRWLHIGANSCCKNRLYFPFPNATVQKQVCAKFLPFLEAGMWLPRKQGLPSKGEESQGRPTASER